jgi:hypothetical protein
MITDLSGYDKVYLDLDRTLFDTDKYITHCATMLINHLGVDSIEFLSETKKFSLIFDEKTYHYLMFRHCRNYGLNPIIAREFLLDTITPQMFMYADAIEFVENFPDRSKLEIVTFGVEEEQGFKIETCPVLGSLVRHVSLRPKAEVLARISAGQKCVIIDDKLIPDLPEGISQIHITRAGATDTSIASFAELKF